LPRENPAIETNDSNEDESSAISLLASLSHSEPRKAVALSYDFSDDSSTDVDDEPLTTATHSAERSSSSQSEVWTISTHEAHCNICNKSFVSRSKSKRDRHEKSEGHKTNLRQQQTRGRKRPREAARKTQQFMTKAVSNNVMDAISSDFADDIPTDLGNVSTTTTTTRKQNVIDADEWNKIRDRIGIKIKQRKFDQAMQQAQQAIERANQNKQPKYTLLARYQIAVIQHKQGNLKGAIRDYQTVLSKARKDNPHITSYAEKRLREATKELSAKRQKTHNSTTSIADQVNPVSGEPLQ
jgi:tetratricopeptide (TPR) repeat protein